MMKDDIELVKREVSYQESQPVSSSRSRERSRIRNENTVGILRLEPIRPRRSSGSPVKFRTPSKLSAQGCAEPVSPQPSVDRLSVTFAAEAPSVISMDKVRFESNKVPPEAEEEEEEEDYSQSVSAIFQRKASTRRSHKRRRSSSPKFVGEVDEGQNSARLRNRRRSSVFTTSSGDTAISVEDAVQEQILQNIKLHKEVLSSVKQQPWNMRRKLRLVRQAKAYIRRHEGELQERLAQSRSTRDILARFNIVIIRHWQHTKRELANLMNVLIPWEIRIKEIESHFGSVVASYFTFLRWLFWVNLVTAVILIVFVAVPEMVMSNPEKSGMRKKMLEHEEANATNLFTLWDFDGVFKYSPLFYGYYSHRDPEPNSLAKKINYSMPLAYFITELVVYIYSFVAILRRMAENSRQSKLSEKDDECVFTWKLFTGWDYMIGNAETAHNRTASIILGFKEALLEEAEKKRDEGRNWKVTSLRVFAHMNVVWLLGSSVYAVILVVQRSTEVEEHHGWWRKNEITIVVSLITSLFPVFFEVFGIIEQYHPRKKLRMQLARIMALNLLNIYTLIFASFSKINEMSDLLEKMRENVTRPVANGPLHQDGGQFHDYLTAISPSTWDQNFSSTPEWYKDCKNITIPCSMTSTVGVQLILGISVFTSNLSTFTTSESMDGQFSSISSTSSLSTDSFTQNYQVFRNSNTVSENISYFNTSTINFIPENVTLSAEVMNEENDTLLTDFVGSELYNFIPANNHSESDLSEFDNYVFGMDSNNITNFNNSEEDSLNKTGAESTTDIISTLQFITFSTDSDSATEIDNQTSPPDPFVTSINDEITSSSNPESTFEEEKCVVLQCETVTKPLLKPTVPTSYVTDPNHASATSTQFTTTTIGSHDSGYPSHRWSKSVPYPKREDLTPYISSLDMETRKKLVPLCWETMFGREMVKLTVMDLVMTVISTLMVDFFRAVFVRFMNNCWCWDLEKKFPQYGDFKIAENILHLVNNQGMVWMGMFFSPGLPLINVIKLAIMMYLRSWAVLTCNVPHEVVFRASRSNNFYLALLLTMLFLCVLPVGYAVVWVVPSWHCGPFSTYHRIYHIFTSSLKKGLPYDWLHKAFDYIASPSIVIPLLMLLVLIIYYLISLTSALREANNDLKIQLRRERTEERRKMFQLVDKKIQEAENPSLKWKKALPNFPYGKLSIADIPIDLLKVGAINGTANYESAQKELIEEFMKKAKRMPSGTSEEENALVDAGDGTDAEQHDSLPYDVAKHPKYSELIVKKDGAVKKLPKDEESKKRNGKKKISKEKHSSSKEGDGSENSGWSEIPEIRIIQTESTERLDDVDNQSLGYTPNEIKASKVKNNKPKSGSLQQKVKKRHEKKTRNEKEEIMSLESVAVHVSPKHSKKVHKQKKRSSSKTDGESSIDTAGSGNENYEDGSFSESSKKGADKISAEKSKLFKLKTAVNASQALRNKGKDAKKKHSDRNNGDKKTRTNKRKISNSEESSEQKLSKLNLKGDNGDQETTLEPSHDSGDDSHAKYTESDYDSEKYEDEKQRRDQLNSSSEEKSGDSKSESDEELSNSDENGNDSSNSESKTSTKQLKKQSNSTESDASSQNTVKQVNFSKQKKENKKVLESDRNNEERESKTQTPKENKTSKKAMARFKIANVLLKEARRRSSSGLEEK